MIHSSHSQQMTIVCLGLGHSADVIVVLCFSFDATITKPTQQCLQYKKRWRAKNPSRQGA